MPSWNTNPATSGPHYVEPAIWGRYTDPIEQARIVHNLEHGGVFILYGDEVPAETVEQLNGFYDDHVSGTIMAPLPSLGDEIALGAWTTEGAEDIEGADRGRGFLAKCTEFDDGRLHRVLRRAAVQGAGAVRSEPPDAWQLGESSAGGGSRTPTSQRDSRF